MEFKALGKGTCVELNLKKDLSIGVLWAHTYIFYMYIRKVFSEKYPRKQNLKQS